MNATPEPSASVAVTPTCAVPSDCRTAVDPKVGAGGILLAMLAGVLLLAWIASKGKQR